MKGLPEDSHLNRRKEEKNEDFLDPNPFRRNKVGTYREKNKKKKETGYHLPPMTKKLS